LPKADKRVRELAAAILGRDEANWADVFHLLSSEYGWTPRDIERMTLDQIGAYLLAMWREAASDERPQDAAGIVLTVRDSKPDPTLAAFGLDCRTVAWFGSVYTFTPTQAACVKVLLEHYKNGVPEVGESTILTNEWVDSSQTRLASVFDNGKHAAWGTMIKPGSTKGTVRLAKPGE
jgi:hypothetical protein